MEMCPVIDYLQQASLSFKTYTQKMYTSGRAVFDCNTFKNGL